MIVAPLLGWRGGEWQGPAGRGWEDVRRAWCWCRGGVGASAGRCCNGPGGNSCWSGAESDEIRGAAKYAMKFERVQCVAEGGLSRSVRDREVTVHGCEVSEGTGLGVGAPGFFFEQREGPRVGIGG